MLSEEEKQEIIDKVRFEQEIKQSLESDKKSSKTLIEKVLESLNGGFALLVAGSIVSVLIVPKLQYNQQENEWKRQVKTDYVKFKLGMMRDCYQSFNDTESYFSQAVEAGKQIDSPDKISDLEHKEFKTGMAHIIQGSVQSSAKALSLTISFPDRTNTRQAILDYDDQVQRYIDKVDRLLEVKYQWSSSKGAQADDLKIRLDRLSGYAQDFQDVSRSYDKCNDKISRQLAEQESRFENFNFTQLP